MTTEQVFKILLFIHIAGGATSLIIGSVILLLKKGDARHKLLGNTFFYSMLTAALVALLMSYLHPNYFLFIIGVFTAYMLLSGKRYLSKKSPNDVRPTDWVLTLTMFLFALGFIGFGGLNLSKGYSFGIIFLVFGAISLLFVYQDKVSFTGQSRFKNFGLMAHIQRMVGGYIASATAFLVVNNTYLPSTIAWLLPTVLLTPLITIWTRRVKIERSKG
jgi:uncharacterized membrane protein